MLSRSCETLAHDLARAARTALAKVAVAGVKASRTATVARRDFATPSAYRGLPGCVGLGNQPCQPEATPTWQDAVANPWLQDVLAARLPAITRTPAGHTERNHRSVARGADAYLTLDPQLQAMAGAVSDCARQALYSPLHTQPDGRTPVLRDGQA